MKRVLTYAVLIVLGSFLIIAMAARDQTPAKPPQVTPRPISTPESLVSFITVEGSSWQDYYGLMRGEIKLHNTAAVALRDISFRVAYVGGSGTVLSEEESTITEVLKAGETRVFSVKLGPYDSRARSIRLKLLECWPLR
jgi:hypothetical protein